MIRRQMAGGVLAAVAALVLAGCGPAASPGASATGTVSPIATTTAATTPPPTTTSAPVTTLSTTPAPPTTTPPPTTARPYTAPATHRVTQPPVRRTTAAPQPRTAVCSIRSAAGNCYRAGQFCRKSDLGRTTTDAEGRTIRCVMQSGRPHWHY